MLKSTLLLISLLLTLNATPLLKTGQSISYDENETIITDGSLKDDGYYQAGATRSYSRNNDVVTDHLTGLQWQDNNETVIKQFNSAIDYCSTLSLDGIGWRLPSVQELVTIVDYVKSFPSTTEGVFQNTLTDSYMDYLSSTAYIDGLGYLTPFKVGFGARLIRGNNGEPYSNFVRCVRGEGLDDSNFSRDDITQIVTDSTTGLQWQDNADAASTERTWMQSVDYCESLILNGDNDWRLPNITELYSIWRYGRFIKIDPSFVNIVKTKDYWSSSTSHYTLRYAAYISFDSNYSGYTSKINNSSKYACCIRGGQLDNLTLPYAPAIINASDGEADNNISLDWTETPNTDYYTLYRSTSKDFIGDVISVPTNNSFVDYSMEVNKQYYYSVQSCNSIDCSDHNVGDSGYAGELPQSNSMNPAIIMYLLN